jgi:hypothetical protein
MDKTELGRAGELAIALYSIVSSDGELELFTPVADDDHVDATAGRRGGVPAIAIQVKTAHKVDRNGSVEATADYPIGRVREHPAFLYAVLLLSSVQIQAAWLLPSLTSTASRTGAPPRSGRFWNFAATHFGTTATRGFASLRSRSARGC